MGIWFLNFGVLFSLIVFVALLGFCSLFLKLGVNVCVCMCKTGNFLGL